jgi:hypothetical protein
MGETTPDSVSDSVRNLILNSIPGVGTAPSPRVAPKPSPRVAVSEVSVSTQQRLREQLENQGGTATTESTKVSPVLQKALMDESMKKADEFFSRLM